MLGKPCLDGIQDAIFRQRQSPLTEVICDESLCRFVVWKHWHDVGPLSASSAHHHVESSGRSAPLVGCSGTLGCIRTTFNESISCPRFLVQRISGFDDATDLKIEPIRVFDVKNRVACWARGPPCI
jgi:hypothetical protein